MGFFGGIKDYFGIGQEGLGEFGRDVNSAKNIASTTGTVVNTALDFARNSTINSAKNIVDKGVGFFSDVASKITEPFNPKNAQKYPKNTLEATLTPQGEEVVKKRVQIAQEEEPFIRQNQSLPQRIISDTKKAAEDRKLENTIIDNAFERGDISQKESQKLKRGEDINRPLSESLAFASEIAKRDRENINNIAFTLSGEPLKDVGEELSRRVGGLFSKAVDEFVGTAKAANDNYSQFSPESYVFEMTNKQKLAGEGKNKDFASKAKDFVTDVKRKLVDSNAPIEDAIRTAQKKYNFEVRPEYDITHQIDRTLRSPTLAGQFAKDKGLVDVIKNVDNIDNLDQYLIARQARDVEARGIKTGRDLQKDSQLIEAFGPKYEEMAQKVNQYSRDLLEYSVDSGLVSRKLADELIERYPNYVPINRIFGEMEKIDGPRVGKGTASLSRQNVVQRLEGSEREIESPLASLLAKTDDAFSQGERNKTARILASYEKLPGFENLIKEIPEGNKAKNSFSYLDDGVKRTFETTPEIEQAAKNLNQQQMSILGKIVAFPVRLAKIGITGINIPFTLTNLIKDQLFSAITSKKAIATNLNPNNFLRSFLSAVGHDELYQDLVRSGAAGTSFDIARNQAKQTIQKIRSNRSVKSKIAYTVKNPSELFRAIEDIIGRSEELTRIQQFRGTRQALLKEGRTAVDANILAAKAARENTANFSRRGEWGKVLNSTFLYLNANIQGSRAFIRAITNNPIKTGVKVATTVFFPVAVSTAWNLGDEKRKEVYNDIPTYEKEGNIIIIPPNPTKNEKGNWNVIKIPLPPGVSSLAIPVRKGVEQIEGFDKVKFRDIAKSLYGGFDPIGFDIERPEAMLSNLTPQIIKPTLEGVVNQNLFTGLPQVSRSLEDLSPELQVKQNTSGSARKIGSALDLSPIKVEEWIKGTFGGVGSQVLNLTDRALANLDIIPKDQIGGKSITESIASRFTNVRSGEKERNQTEELFKILQDQKDENFRLRQEAELVFSELKQLPKDQANSRVKEIKEKNSRLFERIRDIAKDDKLGITYDDRLLRQLGVENKARATFIVSKINTLKTPEEKNTYIKDLRNKKIVTDEVFKQIKEMVGK